MKSLTLLFLSVFILSSCASTGGARSSEYMTGEQIKLALTGGFYRLDWKIEKGVRNVHTHGYFRENNEFLLKSNQKKKGYDTIKWWVHGNKFCDEYPKGRNSCGYMKPTGFGKYQVKWANSGRITNFTLLPIPVSVVDFTLTESEIDQIAIDKNVNQPANQGDNFFRKGNYLCVRKPDEQFVACSKSSHTRDKGVLPYEYVFYVK